MESYPLSIMNLISGDGRTGSDKLAFDISIGLHKRGHKVIWGSPSNCYLQKKVDNAGIERYILNHSSNKDMTSLPAFLKYCNERKLDIVNVHDSHGRHLLVLSRIFGL